MMDNSDNKEWATSIAPTAETLMRDRAEKGKVEVNEQSNTMKTVGNKYTAVIFKEDNKMVIYDNKDDNRIVAAINRDTGKGVYADPKQEDKDNWQKIKESYDGVSSQKIQASRPKEEMEV